MGALLLLLATEEVLLSHYDDPGERRLHLGWEFPGRGVG